MTLREDWEREAPRWAAWARTPGHDVYPHYAPGFFELVPEPRGRTLEIGCGEGRVSRDLAAQGHRVTGIDGSPTLLELAREADPGGEYLLADAAALPFADDTFGLVVAYNVLMDLDDMPGALREAARVLVPRGSLCVCVTHPVQDIGAFEGRQADAPFVIESSYLESTRVELLLERGGLAITFRGWSHSLETYWRALEDAGFAIDRLREPPAPPSMLVDSPRTARWSRIPMFLWLRARLEVS
jgi:SAM-dependent methyltransferase